MTLSRGIETLLNMCGGGLVLLEERIRSWVDVQLEAGLLEKARVVDVAGARLDAEQLSDVADELGAALSRRGRAVFFFFLL